MSISSKKGTDSQYYCALAEGTEKGTVLQAWTFASALESRQANRVQHSICIALHSAGVLGIMAQGEGKRIKILDNQSSVWSFPKTTHKDTIRIVTLNRCIMIECFKLIFQLLEVYAAFSKCIAFLVFH